jgi:alpha-glucan, water dikinase
MPCLLHMACLLYYGLPSLLWPALSQVVVDEWKDGSQEVLLSTTRPGRLLLHWGVEGGRDYKGGWFLPGPDSQPPGTVNYKDRALQTPFT